MFGNDNSQQGAQGGAPQTNENGEEVMHDGNLESSGSVGQPPVADPSSVFPPSDNSNDPFGTTPANNNGDGTMQPHPDEPANGQTPPTNNPFSDVTAGVTHHADDTNQAMPAPATPQPAQNAGDDGLIGIKQQALQQLSPLVKHLDQSAEEKFKTTMMMIQASDNQDLVPEAFEAAKAIEDDKARAQALLDIINEINYFTQNTHQQ